MQQTSLLPWGPSISGSGNPVPLLVTGSKHILARTICGWPPALQPMPDQLAPEQSVSEDGRLAQMIDEVHTLIGAGAAEGAIDAANILKPALARGELQCIGATTLDEYRKHIEKDPALER